MNTIFQVADLAATDDEYTSAYVAPERIRDLSAPDEASDAYSFAMLAWFVATAPDMTPGNVTEPWAGVSQVVIEHKVESKERPPIPEDWSLEPGVQGFVQVTCLFWLPPAPAG